MNCEYGSINQDGVVLKQYLCCNTTVFIFVISLLELLENSRLEMTAHNNLNPNIVDIPLDESMSLTYVFTCQLCSFTSLSYFLACNCLLCATGFDTTYPDQLKNLISLGDFKQSITNINHHYPKSFYLCLAGVAILMVVALAFIGAGIAILIQAVTSRNIAWITGTIFLILIGIVICCSSCCCFIKQTQRFEVMKRVLEEESKKYEAQHCQWRLIAKRDESGLFTSRRNQPKKFHVSQVDRLLRFVVKNFLSYLLDYYRY